MKFFMLESMMSGDVERVSACLKGWDEVGQLSEADDFLQLSGSLLYALRAASCLTTAGSCERLGVSSAREFDGCGSCVREALDEALAGTGGSAITSQT